MHRAGFAILLLVGAACSDSETPAGRLLDDAGVEIRLPAPPRRIVSLNPATTELIFALGAGDRLVGRTTWCDYPEAAARVADLGNGIGPNVEAVLGVAPDLVLLYRSGANAAAAGRLRGLGIPVLELRTDLLADLDRVIGLLGRVLGVQPAADRLIAQIGSETAAATRERSGGSAPTVFILAWNRPPLTLGRGSFLSEILDRAGARNLFADLAAPSAPVSIEAVARRDPDFILTHSVDLPAFARLPEWQVVRAVRERRFLRVHGSEFNRPSPRIGRAISRLAALLDSLSR